MSNLPETLFTNVGDDRVAYQVFGKGPFDLVLSAGQWGHIDIEWEMPGAARFMRQLASFSRLIRFDPRGSGLSDARPDGAEKALRIWAEDLNAVLDAVGSKKASIMTWVDGGMFAMPFAIAYPERIVSLVLFNPVACYASAPDYPEGNSPEITAKFLEFTSKNFGTDRWSLVNCPSLENDAHALQAMSKACRAMSSPKAAVESFKIQQSLDVREALCKIRVPTLVMARDECAWAPVAQTRYVAERIGDAKFVEVPGCDLNPFNENPELILDHIERFITGQSAFGLIERSLLTILFIDIVDSTKQAAFLGDGKWRSVLDRHDDLVREQIVLYGGMLVERAGDGTLATFMRPSRAIECAHALHGAVKTLNLDLRAGIHTAEVELRSDGRIGGINVHLCARVMAQAEAGEVMVSHVVQGMLLGSHYQFEDRGCHELKGIAGECHLYSSVSGEVLAP